MKKTILNFVSATLLIVTGAIITTNSNAASTVLYPNNTPTNTNNNFNVYIDGNIGLGSADIDEDSYYSDPITGAPASEFQNFGFAWNADLGLQFSKYLAVEAGYISFGQSSANTTYNSVPLDAKDSFAGFDVLLKGILPISNKFNLFAKLGTADMNNKSSASIIDYRSFTETGTTWTPLVGIGTSYAINQYISLNLEDMYSVKTTYHVNNSSVDMPGLNAILAGVNFKYNL